MTRTAVPTTADSTAFHGTSGHPAREAKSFAARLRRIVSEPFLHFTLLGALVFAGHRMVARGLDVPTVEVSVSRQRELVKLFEQRQRRAPNDAEREELIRRYVEDEALFREGLRLSLVHTDPMLRAQIIARVRGMLQAELDQKPPTDAELQRYHEAHVSDYAIPETISYREYLIRSGPDADGDARRLLSLLERQEAADGPGLPIPTDHSHRSEAQLASLYGPELAHELWTLPSGSWRELRSSSGVHIVRVAERTAASQPSFAVIREQVSADYRKDRTARAFQAELSRLTSQWRVQIAEQP
ncbi:peptidyl-prolyl cis-trans isomerase [Sorangium sp. So ce1389]|uniref:peptidylprolyl isomerase n=1 Tax=Sorangium sp. So ce1389 TaxID=3133336 RepID=UPI003F5F2700